MPESLKRKKERVAEITRRLENAQGIKRWKGNADPLDELMLTLLSQSTNDRNRDLAYGRLREAYPTWDGVLAAGQEAVAERIKPAGLSNQKSGRMIDILRWIMDTYGTLSLDFLHDMPADEAFDIFTKLKGVGVKTMAVVLMFACGRDVFPVDTHVHRICSRLGLVPENADAIRTFHLMAPLVPEGKGYSLHMNFLQFGRTLCSARNPKCPQCPLYDLCPWDGKIEV